MASFGTFFGFNLSVNAMQMAQQAQSIISNNLSNASTPGYTEEVSNIVEQAPFPPNPLSETPVVSGQVGQGSVVQSVNRQVNAYYNRTVRDNLTSSEGQSTLLTNLNQLQGVLNEPTTSSVHSALDNFFASWQTLSTQPQSTAARQSVIQQAVNLGQTFSTIQNQMVTMIGNLDTAISGSSGGSQVDEVNQYANQINQLNQQIVNITAMGQNPNQLLDQRGLLLNNLAKLGNMSYTANSNGSVDVVFGGVHVVSTSTGFQTTSFTAQDAANVTSGSIWANEQGIQTAQNLIGQLGELQSTLGYSVNQQLEQGYQYNNSTTGTANDLFSVNTKNVTTGNTTTAVTTMSVVPGFTEQQLAAASSPNSPGDGTNAQTIAAMQNSTTLQDSSGTSLGSTPDGFYSALITGLGAKTNAVSQQSATASALLQQSKSLQQSVSGVNIDQETAKMVQFQNIYNAAAKFVSIQNQMLQTLIQEV